MVEEYKYQEITHKIIGCAMEVHKFLGNGFQEVIYQRALAYELSKAGLEFDREIEQDIFYQINIHMLQKRLSKTLTSQRTKHSQFTTVASNSLLFLGAMLIVSALIYLLINLEKSDSLIVILLPNIVAGIALLFISQLIMPGLPRLRRRKRHEMDFTNR
jgi:PD-(D/E)XK nuclease superfamily